MFDSSFARDLVMAAHRLEGLAEKYVFEPMGLTSAGARILKLLIADGPATPSQLLPRTGGTKSNLTQRLNHLEKQGFIRRTTAGVTDRRSVVVDVTAAGRTKMADACAQLADPTRALESMFTSDEIAAQRAFIAKLNTLLDQHTAELTHVFQK